MCQVLYLLISLRVMFHLILYLVISVAKASSKDEMCRTTANPSRSFTINRGPNMLKEKECTDILIVGAKYLFEFCTERQYKATLKMTLDSLKKERQFGDFYKQTCARIVHTMPARDFIIKMESVDECGNKFNSSCHIKTCPHRVPKASVTVDGGPDLLQLPVCEKLFWPEKYTLQYCIQHLTNPVLIKIKKEADVIALTHDPCVTVLSHFHLGEALYSFTYEDKCSKRGAYICNFIGSHDVEKDFIDAITRIHSPMLLLAIIPLSLLIIIAGVIQIIRANRIAALKEDVPVENFQPVMLTSRIISKDSDTKTIPSTAIKLTSRKVSKESDNKTITSTAETKKAVLLKSRRNSKESDTKAIRSTVVMWTSRRNSKVSDTKTIISTAETKKDILKAEPSKVESDNSSESSIDSSDSGESHDDESYMAIRPKKISRTSARSLKNGTAAAQIHSSGTKRATRKSKVSSSWMG